jgi:UDP-glucuronate 4-epimerase
MALFLFTKNIIEDQPINIFNHGNHLRDFTYIDDIVEGIVKVVDRPAQSNPDWNGFTTDPGSSSAPYRLYNIGNNKPVQLNKYIDVLETCLEKQAKKVYLPLQPGDMQETFADVESLIEEFNYKPDTTIEVGIKQFVDWYLAYYNVGNPPTEELAKSVARLI